MSKSAGTLITTHNATYIPPRFMPGYRGHVPTMKFDYGETYGSHTQKYFQDFRSDVLNQSKTNYCKGGYFPTYYSYNPDLAVEARKRTHDRWLQAPRYSITPQDYDGRQNQIKFDKLSKAHREHYNDKSGTVQRVDYFMLPTKSEDQFKKHLPFMVLSERYTDDINIPNKEHIASRTPAVRNFTPSSSQRDREMRDVYFENR